MKLLLAITLSAGLFVGFLTVSSEELFSYLSSYPSASTAPLAINDSVAKETRGTTTVAAPQKAKQPKAPKTAPSAQATSTTFGATSTKTFEPEPLANLSYAAEIEQNVHAKVNALRVAHGLLPLTHDERLANVARAHSIDMLEQGYFDHTNKAGCTSSCRVTNAGYAWRAVGENIYMMSGYTLSAADAAQKAVDGWTNSPGHYANMVNDVYTYEGIGVAVKGDEVYVTELLAKPR